MISRRPHRLSRQLPLPLLAALIVWFAPAAQALERWVYCSQNLWVDRNVTNLVTLFERASAAGYTHVLLADSKFGHLADMDPRYFRNVEFLKATARRLQLEIVPALFPIGYSNDLLYADPNLIEGLPVIDVPLVVRGGQAELVSDPALKLPGGDFEDLSRWTWKDPTVEADHGTARVTDPAGRNARIVQHLAVRPFRQYHLTVRVKTQGFATAPEVHVLAAGRSLNFADLGVKPTQDWTPHHVVFNSLTNSAVDVYFGVWGGTVGSLWWDDATITETAFVNLIRRPGAPLTVRADTDTGAGRPLLEGVDFEPLNDPLMGTKPWPGSYDVYHPPPRLRTRLADGTRLRASWYHAVTVNEGQAVICPSEPKTVALLEDQARRMHAAWSARGYFMSHDEIRVLNWCAACQSRHLDAGALLADNVRTCTAILRRINPGGRIHVWSDMFDPHHNARDNYYLVRGNLTNSWLGLDRDVVVVPWYFEQRDASLKFFADRGHHQLIAGYYDDAPGNITRWLSAAAPHPGIDGVMYTTWRSQFGDLEKFGGLVGAFPAPARWSETPPR